MLVVNDEEKVGTKEDDVASVSSAKAPTGESRSVGNLAIRLSVHLLPPLPQPNISMDDSPPTTAQPSLLLLIPPPIAATNFLAFQYCKQFQDDDKETQYCNAGAVIINSLSPLSPICNCPY